MGTVNVTEERIELTTVDKASIVVKQVQGAYKDLRSSIDTVKNALSAVGVTVGAGAMLNLYHDVLKATAALDDMAESTGASVENLSGLQRVAKVAGFDFGNVTEAMGKVIKGLKGADESGQNAAHALEFLGIQAKNTDGTFRDQGEVMVEVAKKLAMYTDNGNKVALVQDIYGKGAQRLLPYLKDLAEQTDYLATVTGKQAAQAEEAEKNMKRLQLTMEDARRELVIGITPAITDFTEKLLLASKASGGLMAGLATMVTASTGNIEERLKELSRQIEFIEGMNTKFTNAASFGAMGLVTGMFSSDLRNERAYLEALQAFRQKASASAGAKDPNSPLFEFAGQPSAYQSPDKRKFPKGLSPMEQRALQLQQQQAKEATGPSEFMETSLALKAGKYNTIDEVTGKVRELTAAEKQYLLQLSAGADTERSWKELREDKLKADVETIQLTDAAKAAQQARSQALIDSMSTETERENKEYRDRLSNLAEYLASSQGQIANGAAMRETLEMRHQQNLLAIERNKHEAERSMQVGTWQLGAELLQQFAGKSRAAAIMVIAINKALAIAATIQNTAGAVMRAMFELGPIAGPPAAAFIETLGGIQIGLIAATGLMQAGSVGSSGASFGSPANPVSTTPGLGASSSFNSSSTPVPSQTVINVTFTGNVNSKDFVAQEVAPLLRDLIDNSDVTIIGANSRQAADLADLAA